MNSEIKTMLISNQNTLLKFIKSDMGTSNIAADTGPRRAKKLIIDSAKIPFNAPWCLKAGQAAGRQKNKLQKAIRSNNLYLNFNVSTRNITPTKRARAVCASE